MSKVEFLSCSFTESGGKAEVTLVVRIDDPGFALPWLATLRSNIIGEENKVQQTLPFEAVAEGKKVNADKKDASYEEMSRVELKRLAVERGLIEENSRLRAPALVDLLKAGKKEEAKEVVKVKKAKVVEKPKEPVEEEVLDSESEESEEPDEPSKDSSVKDLSLDIPDQLLQESTTFRQVMEWLISLGYKTSETIVPQIESLKPHIPAIQRLAGNLDQRVGRALIALIKD